MQNAQNRLLSAHIKPPPPLPNGSELRKYLRPYVFQPYQTPATTAPKIRKRVKENQPAPDSGVWNLSRCASAAERIAEDTATEMILPKVLQLSQMARGVKTPRSKKYVLMCITDIASHGGQTYKRIQGKRDVFQCEAVAPFFPC